jgi:hypothetical protein
MPENENDLFLPCAQTIKTASYELLADPATLMVRQYCDGRQRDGASRHAIFIDPHPAEQDVTDDLGFPFGDQRDKRSGVVMQMLNEASFIRTLKSSFVDGTYDG